MLHSIWQAGQILWDLHTQADSFSDKPEESLLVLEHSLIEMDVYQARTEYRGTLVVVHGMSPKGKRDPRITALCNALSHVGFKVLAPEIISIKSLTIDAADIQTLAAIFQAVAENESHAPNGKIGVLAPSFSGAMALAAAAMPNVSERIEAICAIGAFTQVETVMKFLLQANEADAYGRFIALKKIIGILFPFDNPYKSALDAALDDNINERCIDAPDSALQGFLQSLNVDDRKQVNRLFQDAVYRDELFTASKAMLSEELAAINIIQHVDGLKARVFLLHGRSDMVIPCEQSKQLYRQLKSSRKKVDLVITPFINHGDTRFRLVQLPDVARIIQGFSVYFRTLSSVSVHA